MLHIFGEKSILMLGFKNLFFMLCSKTNSLCDTNEATLIFSTGN